ncbi:protein kinase domain-containing protein [Phthorimaea operculella]|nr:protein kinase domain-containing protein [Phthorimaea operculella]
MSERYEHSKSKVYKSSGEETSAAKKKLQKSQRDGRKASRMESRTPPLPQRRTSIEELIKKRETLKEELKKMVKHSDSDLARKFSTKYEHRNHSKSCIQSTCIHSRKRSYSDKEPSHGSKKKFTVEEFSPEHTGDIAIVESEDEETIIEKSRQRRKKLLEALKPTQDKQTQGDSSPKSKNINMNAEAAIPKHEEKPSSNPTVSQLTDMFSEADEFGIHNQDKVTQDETDEIKDSQLTDNWDDDEGYYNIIVGDKIDKKRYTIKSILGKGVFSNVVRASDSQEDKEVAIKIIRNNDLTHRTGLKEIEILKEIRKADPDNKYHCVTMIRHFMHRNHLCMVMESLHMDMRHIIKKYGHHHGLNMKAVISYSRQLLVALRLLKKIGLVHADIKPDNILVNEKKNVLKLCDFGSASKVDTIEPTPYMVSRFYRAPEIILGVPYEYSVDIWSAACTIYEMATGRIMFPGNSNNKMLKYFMDLKGKFSTKFIKRGKFKDQHFNFKNNFLIHKKDEHSGREKYVEMVHIPITRDLHKDLKKYSCDGQAGRHILITFGIINITIRHQQHICYL